MLLAGCSCSPTTARTASTTSRPTRWPRAEYLYEHAPRGSLLIEGTRNYPGQFKNYERFDYVTLSREPRGLARASSSRDPVGGLRDVDGDPRARPRT